MASEPKRPVEKMIEALAKARRGEFGDEPDMPNPMRARLHDEVSSTLTENERAGTRPSWLTMFWPRLAVAAAMATLLVLVPAIWWNKTHPVASSGQLASRDSAAVFEESKPVAPEDALTKGSAAASAPAPNVNLADNNQVRIEPEATPGADAQALEESNRLAEARSTRALPVRVTKGYISKESAAQPRVATAAAPPAGEQLTKESDRIPGAGAEAPVAPAAAAAGTRAKQQFSQNVAAQSFRNNVPLKQHLLNTFQVEQQGTEIRVVDSDGSTYTGKIEQMAQNEKQAPAKQKQKAPQLNDEAGSQESQSYFRATGFNVSLKKNVVFEGNYTEASPPAQSLTANKPAQAQAEQQQQQRQDRARIVGEARVNGEQPVQVDAVAESMGKGEK
ncbi:MAG TPA: hypothetical protein VGM62_19600 [Chthoniobacterales bacterium]|jgi:hypothetical protein